MMQPKLMDDFRSSILTFAHGVAA